MTPQEINKNTEKHTMLFLNKQVTESNPILKEELRHFKAVDKLPLTKEVLYIHERQKKEELTAAEE